MARSNRSRGRAARAREEHPELDVDRLTAGWRRTEVRGGREWNVQPVAEAQAVKAYICPGCGLEVAPGVARDFRKRDCGGDDGLVVVCQH